MPQGLVWQLVELYEQITVFIQVHVILFVVVYITLNVFLETTGQKCILHFHVLLLLFLMHFSSKDIELSVAGSSNWQIF